VGAFGGLEVEVAKHVADVLFDRALADHEALRDGVVGQPLGHHLEHFTFPGRQPLELPASAGPAQDLAHHLEVDGAAPVSSPAERDHEFWGIVAVTPAPAVGRQTRSYCSISTIRG